MRTAAEGEEPETPVQDRTWPLAIHDPVRLRQAARIFRQALARQQAAEQEDGEA